MKIILHQPEIPQNTGNIGRLCVATNTPLVLIEPLGFRIDQKEIRRSGLDYWEHLSVSVKKNIEEVIEEEKIENLFFLSSKVKKSYTQIELSPQSGFVFGSESKGLPAWLLEKYPEKCFTIPMWGQTRCLNLSSAAAIVLYEGYRKLKGF